jgi:hypothetical protein
MGWKAGLTRRSREAKGNAMRAPVRLRKVAIRTRGGGCWQCGRAAVRRANRLSSSQPPMEFVMKHTKAVLLIKVEDLMARLNLRQW